MTTEQKQQLREEFFDKVSGNDWMIHCEVNGDGVDTELVWDWIAEKVEAAERETAICPKCFDSLERRKELHMGTIVGYKYECIGCNQIYALNFDN